MSLARRASAGVGSDQPESGDGGPAAVGQSARAPVSGDPAAIVAVPTVNESRVTEIVNAMQSGRWNPELLIEKATTWGVSQSVVNRLAAEAGRTIRRGMGDQEAIVGAFLGRLDGLIEHAKKLGDIGAAVRAIDLQARLLKLLDKPKAEQPPDWASLTGPQKLEKIRQGRERLDALEAQVRAEMAAERQEGTGR